MVREHSDPGLRQRLCDTARRMFECLEAVEADPTAARFDELRAATDCHLRATARLLLEAGREIWRG